MKMYKLMESVNGHDEVHTEWLEKKDAEEMRDRHNECFPEFDYWICEHDEEDMPTEFGVRSSHSIDGWEDFFPD